MNRLQLVTVFGLVTLGAVACSSREVPIGDQLGQKSGALGGVGQGPKADGTCDTRLTLCGGACRDLDSDDANCGACASACAAPDTCNAAVCSAPPPPPPDAGPPDAPPGDATTTCPEGKDLCGGACIDVLFDNNNCGACGVTCGGGKSCIRAICM
jgi:Stigma-specific protein, Stig1